MFVLEISNQFAFWRQFTKILIFWLFSPYTHLQYFSTFCSHCEQGALTMMMDFISSMHTYYTTICSTTEQRKWWTILSWVSEIGFLQPEINTIYGIEHFEKSSKIWQKIKKSLEFNSLFKATSKLDTRLLKTQSITNQRQDDLHRHYFN